MVALQACVLAASGLPNRSCLDGTREDVDCVHILGDDAARQAVLRGICPVNNLQNNAGGFLATSWHPKNAQALHAGLRHDALVCRTMPLHCRHCVHRSMISKSAAEWGAGEGAPPRGCPTSGWTARVRRSHPWRWSCDLEATQPSGTLHLK